MNVYALAGLLVGGGLAAILATIWLYGRSKKTEGALDVQRKVQAEATEAIRRANAVLAEHRDPNDANRRLRNGDF
jgi:hypothetical protein